LKGETRCSFVYVEYAAMVVSLKRHVGEREKLNQSWCAIRHMGSQMYGPRPVKLQTKIGPQLGARGEGRSRVWTGEDERRRMILNHRRESLPIPDGESSTSRKKKRADPGGIRAPSPTLRK